MKDVSNTDFFRLRKVLESLGPTSDAVANALRQLGVKGSRKSYCQCPISNYLIHERFLNPEVLSISIVVGPKGGRFAIEPPTSVAEFIVNFDQERYPDLIQWDPPSQAIDEANQEARAIFEATAGLRQAALAARLQDPEDT